MHGVGLDFPLQDWFDTPVPKTTLPPDLIQNYLDMPFGMDLKDSYQVIWIGGDINYIHDVHRLEVQTKQETIAMACAPYLGEWISRIIPSLTPEGDGPVTLKMLRERYEDGNLSDFTLCWYGAAMEMLKEAGLLVI